MKKKFKYGNILTLIIFFILAVTLIYNYIFKQGDRIARIILIAVTIAATRILCEKTFLKKSKAAYIFISVFIMIAMYLGNVLNFYTYIPHYDKILHFISGILIGILGIIIYSYFTKENLENINIKFLMFFSFIFITSLACVWEMWEFITDKIFGLTSQLNSLNDTMTDIIAGTAGGIAAIIYIYFFCIKRKSRLLNQLLDEVIK